MTEPLTEREFTAQLVELATTLGWRRYHTWRSKHSAAGYPDETLVRDRLIFAELKRVGAYPTNEQKEWLTALAKAGVEVYLWTERDLDEIAVVLSGRWHWTGLHLVGTAGTREELWQPRSLWLRAGCRVDDMARAA